MVLSYTQHTESGERWLPVDFKCLPGTLSRVPCLITPYHYRLDWQTRIDTTSLESGHSAMMMKRGRHVPDKTQILIREASSRRF